MDNQTKVNSQEVLNYYKADYAQLHSEKVLLSVQLKTEIEEKKVLRKEIEEEKEKVQKFIGHIEEKDKEIERLKKNIPAYTKAVIKEKE